MSKPRRALRLRLDVARIVPGIGPVPEVHTFACRPSDELIGRRLVAAALPAYPDAAAVWRCLDAVLVDGDAARLRTLAADTAHDLGLLQLTAAAVAVRNRYSRP